MVQKVLFWVSRIVAAVIMLQTLFFKFRGAEESIYIFETVGMEPWGRYMVGVGELFAAILILIPRTVWIGAVITIGLMLGALSMHLLFLGIEVFGDGGQLFIYACTVLVCGFYALCRDKEAFIVFVQKIRHSNP